jgi:predicted PurR-regulated permease PerM
MESKNMPYREGRNMNTTNQASDGKSYVAKAVEVSITVGLVLVIILWCFRIGRPFLETIVWSVVIAVAIHPIYDRLRSILGGRRRLAATLITLIALALLVVPAIMLSGSLVDTIQEYSTKLEEGTLRLPPPSENVKSWPVIGEPLYEFWSLGSNNLGAALSKMAPQLKKRGIELFSTAAEAGVGMLAFVISIIIAGVLLANAERGHQAAELFARRVSGDRGEMAVKLAGATVRSVAVGILGVALIQTFLAGVGFIVVGVPGAGFWALLVLILAIIQLPTILVLGPIIAYVFTTASTITAVVFAVWSILVGISDGFLKPLLMGRGVDVPMLIIFIGAIGGFIASGIIGLFVGAIVFALGYKLFLLWLDE